MNLFKKIILSSILAIGIVSSHAIAQMSQMQQYQVAYELDITNQEIVYIESLVPYLTTPDDLSMAKYRLDYLYQKRDYLLRCLTLNVC